MRIPIAKRFVLPLLLALLCGSLGTASEKVEPGDSRRPALDAWLGTTPVVDGVIAPGEWADATPIQGVNGWVAQFSPTAGPADLSLSGYVKHDGERLYFAFLVTDDLLYGIDTERWLPANNPHAHELSPRGYPWFGDEMEILLNATNTWQGEESARGDASSWQMVCNLTKSRLGGVGVGGLMEGEPRSDARAWSTYSRWIREGSQTCATRVLPGRKGYVIEWAIRFADCVELRPGVYWKPALGAHTVGLNLALGDLDNMATGEGNFGNFHHEDWWAGATSVRTQLRHFGTLRLHPRAR